MKMRKDRGLTTNEILVSVATLAAVMVMAFAAFRGLEAAAESSSTRVRAAGVARGLFARLDSVLPALASHTVLRAGQCCFWGEETACVWEAFSPRELGRPSERPETVSLQFRADEGTVVLTRGTRDEVLARGVQGASLRYAGRQGAFRPSWGERGAGSPTLPAYILVFLKTGGKERSHVIAAGREE